MQTIRRGDKVECIKEPERFAGLTVISDPERFGGGHCGDV